MEKVASNVNRLSPDLWACAAPVACAAHCLSAPLLVVLAPSIAPTATTEWLLLGISTLIAGWVLSRGIGRHGRMSLLIPFAAGVALWVASIAGWLAPIPEELTTLAGSLTIAGSLLINLRWQRQSTADAGCGCSACEPDAPAIEPRMRGASKVAVPGTH